MVYKTALSNHLSQYNYLNGSKRSHVQTYLPLSFLCPEALRIRLEFDVGVIESDLFPFPVSAGMVFMVKPFRARILFRSASVSKRDDKFRYSESGITVLGPPGRPVVPRGFRINLLRCIKKIKRNHLYKYYLTILFLCLCCQEKK